jgi:LPS sulfotransferase NodH
VNDGIAVERTIIIAATPRSGSSLLGGAMTATGRLGRPDEYLNLGGMRRSQGNLRLTAGDCCALARRYGTIDGVLALKMFWPHLVEVETTLDTWFPDRKWIFLRRRDRLGQAISWAIAAQTNKWDAGSTGNGAEPGYHRAFVDHFLNYIDTENVAWQAWFDRNGIVPLDLAYEDMQADLPQTLKSIAAFAGVALPDQAAQQTGVHQRQRTGLNAAWRERYSAGA